MTQDDFADWLMDKVVSTYKAKEEHIQAPLMRRLEKLIMLRVLDAAWQDHLEAMDHLKEGIGLRAYGQRNPLIEYKKEGFEMFQSMLDRIEEDAVRYLFLIQPVIDQPAPVRRQAPVYTSSPRGRRARGPSRPGP